MQAVTDRADLSAMTTNGPSGGMGRGAAIQRRLNALGISDREFHERTGIDRKTLRRAVGDGEKVRPSTYAAIEAAVDRLEAEVGLGEGAPSLGQDFIEFDLSGEGDFHVVVKGPVKDAEVLREQVAALIRQIRRERE